MSVPDPDFLCCELSEELHEPMAGTAVPADVWFMLEYTRPWGAKATTENELPVNVMKWLSAEITKWDGRLQFIRQFRPDADVITFFVGVNDEINPRLYEFHLGDYEDLFELDVAAMVAGNGRYHPHLVTGQRYFVCTNGKRDRSCAVHGAALYRALVEKQANYVWMTTHLGGHRFAPTLLTLPEGVNYGRVKSQNIEELLAAAQHNEILLDKLRGRTCYSPITQTADFHLRQQTNQTKLDAFKLKDVFEERDGRWQIQFQSKDNHTYTVILEQAEPRSVYASSGNLKQKEVPQIKLVDIK